MATTRQGSCGWGTAAWLSTSGLGLGFLAGGVAASAGSCVTVAGGAEFFFRVMGCSGTENIAEENKIDQ